MLEHQAGGANGTYVFSDTGADNFNVVDLAGRAVTSSQQPGDPVQVSDVRGVSRTDRRRPPFRRRGYW